jgi:preprotein translocase subunit SecG
MKAKIDALMSRLDDLEHRAAGANPQLEVMTFIMTGLFLMFIVDLAVRKSNTMRMVNVR